MTTIEQAPENVEIKSYSILVTGATGFIGSRLLAALSKKGYKVKAMSRKKISDKENIKFVQADAFKINELEQALTGIEVSYYLLHSMEGSKQEWKDFAEREQNQARNFLAAAQKAGVKRIIYLGGLVNDSLSLSAHMKSRKEVGEILASGNILVTELRASLIIGAEGGSYAMLRYLVERLRIMVCPKWVESLAQPISVDDVVEYLIGCLEHTETRGKIYEIGGPEKITYKQLMHTYASYLNKSLFVLHIPFLTPRLSSYWVDLITPVKASLARPLIDSLVHDTIVKDDSITKIIPIHLKTMLESIDIATKEIAKIQISSHEEEKTSFKLNQILLLASLFALATIGSTYYWLDDRADVHQPIWIVTSIAWYFGIGFTIIFVYDKTRLGYLVAAILSWLTLSFWLFDNYHIVFSTSIIAHKPSDIITIRNFIGVAVASLAIISSHNVFHKVRTYQKKGKPI